MLLKGTSSSVSDIAKAWNNLSKHRFYQKDLFNIHTFEPLTYALGFVTNSNTINEFSESIINCSSNKACYQQLLRYTTLVDSITGMLKYDFEHKEELEDVIIQLYKDGNQGTILVKNALKDYRKSDLKSYEHLKSIIERKLKE